MFLLKRRVPPLTAEQLRDMILASPGFFDEDYYRTHNTDVPYGYSAFDHFVHCGVHRGASPHYLFDPEFYRKTYADLLQADENPYAHYLATGWRKGLQPHPLFDPDFYIRSNRDVKTSGVEPVSHYLQQGWRQRLAPHPFFDVAFYIGRNPDVEAGAGDPLRHYLLFGAPEGRRLNPVFDAKQYARDHAAEGVTLATAAMHHVMQDKDSARVLKSVSKVKLKPGVQKVDAWAEGHGCPVTRFQTEERVTWPYPVVINRERSGEPLTATLPPAYLAVLKNVRAIPGTRAVVTAGNEMLHDELAGDPDGYYHPKIHDVGRFEKNRCVTDVNVFSTGRIDQAILLSSDTDTNYFHWMVEALPKLWLVEQAKLPQDIPVLIQTGLHDNLMQALTRALGARKYIARPPYIGVEIGKLWYPSDLSRVLDNVQSVVRQDYDIAVSREAVRYIRGKLSPPAVSATRRIYVERASNYRLLVNEAELIEALKAEGFEIVNTTRMTLDQQIETFSQARLIIAPTGAALTNLMFCQPGSHALSLVAENQQSNLNIFNHLGEAVGATVSFCLGDRAFTRQDMHTVHDDFSVDVGAVLKWCASHG